VPERSDFLDGSAPTAEKVAAFPAGALETTGGNAPAITAALVPSVCDPLQSNHSVKAYRREIMDALPMRPDWHRYMIVIAADQGFSVSEVAVPLYPRHAGKSKFGIGRIPVGVLDMLSVWFELRFARKPLLLFGMMGAALFGLGVLAGLVAIGIRIFAGFGYRPLLNLIEICVITGSVFFVGGLLGEMIAGLRAEVRELRRRVVESPVEGDTTR